MRGELGDDARLMHIWEAMNSIVTYTKGADVYSGRFDPSIPEV
jgi:uncharacterized protein with HEPN domain